MSSNGGLHTGVFARKGQDAMGSFAFLLVLGIVLVWGLFLTGGVAAYTAPLGMWFNWWQFLVVGLVIPIIGIIIAIKSDNALVSFVGYNLVVVPFGVILAPVTLAYTSVVLENAFMLTGLVTIVMMVLAMLMPGLFRGMGRGLFGALVALVIVRFVQLLIPGLLALTIIDWLAALLFSLYIGYDVSRALDVPKTLDNAVDIALDLYLDIINLFLTILRIMGASDN